jgi:SAM-dependent methyltransferase
LFESPDAAMNVRRKDVVLVQCDHCSLIFNCTFDASLSPYDHGYENRQSCSPAFRGHMDGLASDLITRHALQGKRILEVGCGQGDFLTLLCEQAGANGVGYDTSYEGPRTRLGGRVRFVDRYVSADDIAEQFDLVVCRHVVEHIGAIGEFLVGLRAIAEQCGNAVTVIETPNFEWTARNGCFWDVFYEHCNYFTKPCLAYLCRLAGFSVARQRLAFGGQYQVLELRVGPTATALRLPRRTVKLTEFRRDSEAAVTTLGRLLERHGARMGWAIWGAGAKGVALANRFRHIRPSFVVDTNPAKQGCFIPATRIPIIAPEDLRVMELELILVANPNYAAEIGSTLHGLGYNGSVLAA